MRAPHFITFQGKTLTLREWSVLLDIPLRRIRARHQCGMPVEKVLSLSKLPTKLPGSKKVKAPGTLITRETILTLMGESMTIEAWARELCIPVYRIIERCEADQTVEACLSKELPPLPRTPLPRQPRPGAPRMRVPSLAELDAAREAA